MNESKIVSGLEREKNTKRFSFVNKNPAEVVKSAQYNKKIDIVSECMYTEQDIIKL